MGTSAENHPDFYHQFLSQTFHYQFGTGADGENQPNLASTCALVPLLVRVSPTTCAILGWLTDRPICQHVTTWIKALGTYESTGLHIYPSMFLFPLSLSLSLDTHLSPFSQLHGGSRVRGAWWYPSSDPAPLPPQI